MKAIKDEDLRLRRRIFDTFISKLCIFKIKFFRKKFSHRDIIGKNYHSETHMWAKKDGDERLRRQIFDTFSSWHSFFTSGTGWKIKFCGAKFWHMSFLLGI